MPIHRPFITRPGPDSLHFADLRPFPPPLSHERTQTLTNAHKHSQTLTNARKHSQTLVNTRKRSQTLANTREHSRTITKTRKRSQTLVNAHRHSQTLTNTHHSLIPSPPRTTMALPSSMPLRVPPWIRRCCRSQLPFFAPLRVPSWIKRPLPFAPSPLIPFIPPNPRSDKIRVPNPRSDKIPVPGQSHLNRVNANELVGKLTFCRKFTPNKMRLPCPHLCFEPRTRVEFSTISNRPWIHPKQVM